MLRLTSIGGFFTVSKKNTIQLQLTGTKLLKLILILLRLTSIGGLFTMTCRNTNQLQLTGTKLLKLILIWLKLTTIGGFFTITSRNTNQLQLTTTKLFYLILIQLGLTTIGGFFTKAFRQSRQSGNSFQWLGQALYMYTNPPVQQEATTGLIRQQRTLASERVARDYRYGGFTGISCISILLGLSFFRQRL